MRISELIDKLWETKYKFGDYHVCIGDDVGVLSNNVTSCRMQPIDENRNYADLALNDKDDVVVVIAFDEPK